MTIRDLLSINTGWHNDYIEIRKNGRTILKNRSIKELHPVWLDYEVKSYFLLPHQYDDERYSPAFCDYIITINDNRIFQDKITYMDEILIGRIKNNDYQRGY